MKKIISSILAITSTACIISACNSDSAGDEIEMATETVTPVSFAHPAIENMQETVEVNAVSVFLLKTFVKSNANGYLQAVDIHLGDHIAKGQMLFVIKTKEAEALGNTINGLDTSLHFNGTIRVHAPISGYITQLTYTSGSYVQDGEQLAEITDTRSFAFLLDLPYELKPYLSLNHEVELHLPDSTVLKGFVQSALPTVDSVSQTQRYIIKVSSKEIIPENLVAKIRLVKKQKQGAITLPKESVLSDETQSEFWVMQLLNDSTAVKVPVRPGMQTQTTIEILSPSLAVTDRILVAGNYGLPDTAKVNITTSN